MLASIKRSVRGLSPAVTRAGRRSALILLSGLVLIATLAAAAKYYHHYQRVRPKDWIGTNVSASRAAAVAHAFFGDRVSAAIPFRNRGDPVQYIAVLVPAGPANVRPGGPPVGGIYLLAGYKGLFTPSFQAMGSVCQRRQPATGPVADPGARWMGAVDRDGDGKNEVALVSAPDLQTGATEVSVLDGASRRISSLCVTAAGPGQLYRYRGAAPLVRGPARAACARYVSSSHCLSDRSADGAPLYR